MSNYQLNPTDWQRDEFDSCGISAVMSLSSFVSGEVIAKSAEKLTERGVRLGAGYAAFGIYPEFKDQFALHIIGIESLTQAKELQSYLKNSLNVNHFQEIEHKNNLKSDPGLYLFIVEVKNSENEQEDLRKIIKKLHKDFSGVTCISSGKNFGVFKGIGNGVDVAEHYKIYNMKAHYFLHHDRFPTNTSGGVRNASPHVEDAYELCVVHNGEVSSYGTNRIFLESYGFDFSISTDSIIFTKAFLYFKRNNIDYKKACKQILCPPTWNEIEKFEENISSEYKQARIKYPSLLIDGPFSIIMGDQDQIWGLRDRKGLRPLVYAKNGDYTYFSSEASSIKAMCADKLEILDCPPGKPIFSRGNYA